MTIPLNQMLDHALLHPTMSDAAIRAGCELAASLELATVCVKPYAVPLAAQTLRESHVGVGTVIGFPHGSNPTDVKLAEAHWAIDQGATELDMVVNVGKVLQGDWDFVRNEIGLIVQSAHQRETRVKVIFETDFVTKDADKRKLCEICCEVSADWVKTSTGFGFTKGEQGYQYTGATEADVRLMVEVCQDRCEVKASGGIRSVEDARKFRDLGCTRLGTSASQTILSGAGQDSSSY